METSTSNQSHPYFGRHAVLTTKHEKLDQIAPAFKEVLGMIVNEVNLDTDQFGTFSGEIERTHPPRETAILKARLGMGTTGATIGLASEGSVGPDPVIPFINSNIEHLVLVDDERGIVISETYRSMDITASSIISTPEDNLDEFLRKVDFPRHKLIVRPHAESKSNSVKGIAQENQLRAAIVEMSKISPNGLVVIESDLRAFNSPSRQKNIEKVARLLVSRVSQLCPDCSTPGWGRVEFAKGLKCEECGEENLEAIRQEIMGCVNCDHTQLGKIVAETLPASRCNLCNP